MKPFLLALVALLTLADASAQTTDTTQAQHLAFVQNMMKELGAYKPDTTSPPADKITQKIIELRKLRGNFNINEVVAFQLEEDKQKGDITAEKQKQLTEYFTTGKGKRWLDNATIWLYRARFTYGELKRLLKFYKTSAGQKMANDFPVIVLESMATAKMLKENFDKSIKAGF